MTRVFIDGAVGTTGLEIRDRLTGRSDIGLITIPEAHRKDPSARADALHAAEIVVLCLPDDAAREAVALIGDAPARVIDASTAHRSDPAWTYGFAEIEPGRVAALAAAAQVSNPGCYPTGFLALVRPLVREGILPPSLPLSVHATSGYSGGGKAMIAEFEEGDGVTGFRAYGLALAHKHVGEMRIHAGIDHAPLFAPSVARTYRGMIVEVPLRLGALRESLTVKQLHAAIADAYAGCALVRVATLAEAAALDVLDIERTAGSDRLELFVFANEATGQVRLVASLDNLGKGAAGAAVQNLNLMAGLPETEGLRL